ncbi:MAG: CDGSH iron-sulfur domain-containing protein [Solirubrobacteraceae bacterium]
MTDALVMATSNGPYKVTGPIEIVDHDGNPVATTGRTLYLCRCGASLNKPFCDGTHAKIGFDGTLASAS